MKNAYVIISVVCAIVRCCPAETGQLQPVGYLRADVYVPEPLSLNTTSRLTTHVFNISNCPVQMHIGRFGFQPCFVVLGTPRTPTKECPRTDVWGPGIDTRMKTVENRVLVSGWDPDAYRPERYGIIVLKDEGYARKVTFLPGWLSKTELPDNCQSLKNLAVDAGVSYKCRRRFSHLRLYNLANPSSLAKRIRYMHPLVVLFRSTPAVIRRGLKRSRP